jgi:hypothetical protein
MGNERAQLAYETFRNCLRYPDDIPAWWDAPSWVRDAVIVAYLQGTLDGRKGFSSEVRQILQGEFER